MTLIFRSLVPRADRQAVGLSRVELWWSLDPGETIQMYPGIVCDESGLCAAIHWGLARVCWFGFYGKRIIQGSLWGSCEPFLHLARNHVSNLPHSLSRAQIYEKQGIHGLQSPKVEYGPYSTFGNFGACFGPGTSFFHRIKLKIDHSPPHHITTWLVCVLVTFSIKKVRK